MTLRISATTLESFNLYLTTDWMTEERFIAELGEFKPNVQMRRGTAFEKALRDPDRYLTPGFFSVDGFEFPRDMVQAGLDRLHPDMIWQVKGTKTLDVDGEEITVVAKTDTMLGRTIGEIKTTETFDLDKYRGSMQWRWYLDIFGSDCVRYLVFEIRESKRNQELYLAGLHEWEEHPYEGMRSDLMEGLKGLVGFIHAKGLEEHFQPKEERSFV